MSLWHVNPTSGQVNLCKAKPGRCPFSEELHGYTAAGALERFEKLMDAETLSALRKRRPTLPVFHINDESCTPLLAKALVSHREDITPLERTQLAAKGRRVLCPECGKPLGGEKLTGMMSLYLSTYGNEGWCSTCSAMVSNEHTIIEPNPNSPTYAAVEASNVSKMLWYHYSDNPQWAESIRGENAPKHVHLGGEAAAADRSVSVGSGNRPAYLYLVQVSPEATVHEHIEQDGSSDYLPSGDLDVYRYLNRYEDPGSISLAANPQHLTVLGQAKCVASDLQLVSTYKLPVDIIDRTIEDYNDLGDRVGAKEFY